MGMTIEDSLAELRDFKPKFLDCKFDMAMSKAISTMRKYQKIEQALDSWELGKVNERQFISLVRKVVEDGNDD